MMTHVYKCPRCKRLSMSTMNPRDFRVATGSFIRCERDGEVLVWKGPQQSTKEASNG